MHLRCIKDWHAAAAASYIWHMYTHMHNIIIILYLVSLGMRRMEECGVVWIEWAPHGGVPLQPVGGRGLYTDGERTTELLKLCSVRNTVHQLSAKIIYTHFVTHSQVSTCMAVYLFFL